MLKRRRRSIGTAPYSSARVGGAGAGRFLAGSSGVGGGVVVAGGGGTPKKWARIWPAIGAADWPPAVPCSTITAIAMRGLSIGAKHMNQPCGWYWCDFLSVSSRACVTTWADPVLPDADAGQLRPPAGAAGCDHRGHALLHGRDRGGLEA